MDVSTSTDTAWFNRLTAFPFSSFSDNLKNSYSQHAGNNWPENDHFIDSIALP